MKRTGFITGFSRMEKKEMRESILPAEDLTTIDELMEKFEIRDAELQSRLESFSENTISNFHLPYGIAPNFLVDGQLYHIPMAIEESSVIAAASKSAKFGYDKGGFQTVFIKTVKSGQIHFSFEGDIQLLQKHWNKIRQRLLQSVDHLTKRMEARGGGIREVELQDWREEISDYYQIRISCETADSMGANFINSLLETMASELMDYIDESAELSRYSHEVIIAILSNYTPESIIRMRLEASADYFNEISPVIGGMEFVKKFCKAVEIARRDISRATTHNKGIMNGADAVVIATGNDFRAVEAAAHTYAAKTGKYASLTECFIENDVFRYELEMPLSVGTVGGLTSLHPLASFSIRLLGNPGAEELMKIIAAAALANNFGALRSLVTEEIQKGHMKLYLDNILSSYQATEQKRREAKKYFQDKKISYADVKKFLDEQRR